MPAVAAPERMPRADTAEAIPAPTPSPAQARPRPAAGRPRGGTLPLRAIAVGATLVVASLLAVVAADAYLTQGQVRLTQLQQQLTSASGTHRDLEARVARLVSPNTVISQAEHDGLSAPSAVTDLPEVTVPPPTTQPSTGGVTATTSAGTPGTSTGSTTSR